MKFAAFRLALPMFDPEQPGGAPAAPSAPSAPAPGAPSGGQPSAPAPGAPAPVTPPAPAGFTYKEDRSNWVPSHVVRQNSERARTLETELRIERERVAALTGVRLPTAPDPESDAIRAQFNKLYPGLSKLEAIADKLEKAGQFDYDGIQQSQQQVWVQRGTEVLSRVAQAAKDAYGGADLPPKTLGRIQRAFVSEVAEDPDMKARYEAGDMSIIDDFIKDYTAGVLDPYRRSTATQVQNPGQQAARRLPRGGGSSAIVGARPATLKPSDPNFHEAAFARFNQ
jgi:hypothetical protein